MPVGQAVAVGAAVVGWHVERCSTGGPRPPPTSMRMPWRGPSSSPAVIRGPVPLGRRGHRRRPLRQADVVAASGGHTLLGRVAIGGLGDLPFPNQVRDPPAAIVSRLAFNPLAMLPVVLCGCSFRYSRTRSSTSSLCRRAVARRLLARRAVARRAERCATSGAVTSIDSGECGVCASSDSCVALALPRPPDPLWEARERKRERDPPGEPAAGPAGLDHGLKLRASARTRFGGFRVRG